MFKDVFDKYQNFPFESYLNSVTDSQIQTILSKKRITELDFLALLSNAATPYLEKMAGISHQLVLQHFGNVVFLFTPLYISNHCVNVCAYCSFARQHDIIRKHLSPGEVRKEAQSIRQSGIRHILVLTGESRAKASVEYLEESVRELREEFSSISIEVYPLTAAEYARLINQGVDGLTIYQETYNQELYSRLHKGGPKDDYLFRLHAPDRACGQGIRAVTVGALFGLAEPRIETFFTGIHAAYLQDSYPAVEVSVSFPRMRPLAGEFTPDYTLSDAQFVQFMSAMRIFLPSCGFTVSTRETSEFRNSILPIGVTKMSAGVSTAVGGHCDEQPSTSQFEIADTRSVLQVKTDLLKQGFQPVMHDWDTSLIRST